MFCRPCLFLTACNGGEPSLGPSTWRSTLSSPAHPFALAALCPLPIVNLNAGNANLVSDRNPGALLSFPRPCQRSTAKKTKSRRPLSEGRRWSEALIMRWARSPGVGTERRRRSCGARFISSGERLFDWGVSYDFCQPVRKSNAPKLIACHRLTPPDANRWHDACRKASAEIPR